MFLCCCIPKSARSLSLNWLSGTLVFFLCAAGPSALGQALVDEGIWTAYFSQGELNGPRIQSDNSLWWLDAHWRYSGDEFLFTQGIIRPGIGKRLNDENSIWAGYAWIGEQIPDFDIHENRFWQQWMTTRQRGDVAFQFRSRLEQRFVSAGAQVGWRFRQLVRAQKSLKHYPNLLWVAWDEIFFHLRDTDWGAVTGYNQNRVFVGMGRMPHKRSPWRTEIGYLYQQIDVPEDGADLSNHILSVNFYFNP